MKLRRIPEDFQVDEVTRVQPTGGPFALYRLTKTSIGTPEAISAIVERLNIHRRRLSYGGLKDRHAVTTQHLTIHNGPRKSLQLKTLNLEYLGQTAQAFTPADIDANRFQLVLRDMPSQEISAAVQALQEVQQAGLPNYFDDQRFGSLGESGEWIAKEWCLGHWERALWLALADGHPNDPSSEKKQKQILRDMWGKWPECQQSLDRSHRRSIVTYLSDKVKAGHPADFRGALGRVNVDLRGLYLSAYQSAIWNRLLNRMLEDCCSESQRRTYSLKSGVATFPVNLDAQQQLDLQDLSIPLPSARIDRPEGRIGDLLDAILAEEGMELRLLRVKYPRDSFFSKGQRRAIISTKDLAGSVSDDELYGGRQKLTLSFQLPRGSYATILVKRITGLALPSDELDDD